MPSLMDKYKAIPVSKLVEAPWNYKKDEDEKSKELMEKLKKNLTKNGQIENLIIRLGKTKGTFEVVNGNHRLKALRALKIKTAVCFDLGKISVDDAKRIAVETNETKFDSDPIKLAELISNIAKKFDLDDLISTLPMSREDIDNYTKMLSFDWSQLDNVAQPEEGGDNPPGMSGDDGEWMTVEFRLPVAVGELFEAQVDRIKRLLYPEKELDKISPVMAIECITAFIDLTPDDQLVSR